MSMLLNGISGLNAANAGMLTVSNNVANANVAGYSRQSIQLATATSGVELIDIDRIVNGFLNQDIWRSQSDLNAYQTMETHVGMMEQVVGNDSLNLESAINDIESAFNMAMSSPADPAFRQQIVSSSEGVVAKVSQLNGAIEDLRTRVSNELSFAAREANSFIQRIGELNAQVTRSEAMNQPTATLRDQREQLINELSAYIAVDVYEDATGSASLSTVNGAPLVSGTDIAQINVVGSQVSIDLSGRTFSVANNIGGRIGGGLDALHQFIEPQLSSLNTMVSNMADQVNTSLSEGYDLNGDVGVALFEYDAANPLATLSMGNDITPERLALAGRVPDGSGGWLPAGGTGNNGNIANITEVLSTATGDYSSIIGELAIFSQQITNSKETAQGLNDNSIASRDAVSGVNLDEEAANLVQYQRLYEANARVIGVAEETFRALLNAF